MLTDYLKKFTGYFDLRPDLVSQQEAEESIRVGVPFRGSQLLVLIFAILIASLGLNTNSIPVIIGAMLISPLMGPIIGMGLAIGIEDYDLLKRGLKNISMAVLGSLLASALYFLISPQYESSSQLLARTSPSIYDVLIGFFGGAAGILSIVSKNKGQVMPGVAIATSLMPPLCTAGYGLATWQMNFFFGALYLFFTNMIFILFATWTAVKILKYKKVVYKDKRYKRILFIVYSIVFATVVLSAYLTVGMIRKNIFLANAADFVKTQMVFPNTQVLNHNEYIKGNKRYIDVTLIGSQLPKDSLQLAMLNKLDSVGLGGTVLHITQGFSFGHGEYSQDENFDKFYELMQNQIAQNEFVIDSLKSKLASSNRLSDEAKKLAPELKVLFKNIQDIAISEMTTASLATNSTDTIRVLFVKAQGGMSSSDRAKLSEYVQVRLHTGNIYVEVNPASFPWPAPKAETPQNSQNQN